MLMKMHSYTSYNIELSVKNLRWRVLVERRKRDEMSLGEGEEMEGLGRELRKESVLKV